MGIAEKQDKFIADFNELADWFMQYEYLLAQTIEMEPLTPSEKSPENLVPGCQSNIWLVFRRDADRLWVRFDSDSLIIKGILGVAVHIFNGEPATEIRNAQIHFIDSTSLHSLLTSEKITGVQSVIRLIQKNAYGD